MYICTPVKYIYIYPPTPAMARGSASGQRGCETTNNQQRATNSRSSSNSSSSSSQFLAPKLDGALLFRVAACAIDNLIVDNPPTPAAQGGARKGKGVCDTAVCDTAGAY